LFPKLKIEDEEFDDDDEFMREKLAENIELPASLSDISLCTTSITPFA